MTVKPHRVKLLIKKKNSNVKNKTQSIRVYKTQISVISG